MTRGLAAWQALRIPLVWFVLLWLLVPFPAAHAQTTAVCGGTTVRAWVTANRPSSPNDGTVGYNLTAGYCEGYSASSNSWAPSAGTLVVSTFNATASFSPVANALVFHNAGNCTLALGSSSTTSTVDACVTGAETVTGTTGTLTNSGHTIGVLGRNIFNMTGTTSLPLGFGLEGNIQNNGAQTTLALAILNGAHMDANAGTITNLVGYANLLSSGENTGTIGTDVDYECQSWVGVTGAPASRFCVLNFDPLKPITNLGQYFNSTSQELGPTVGAGYTASRYYFGTFPGPNLTAAALSAGTAFCAPTYIKARQSFTKVGVRVTTLATSSHVQMAAYASLNGAITGAPIFTTASQSSAATGPVEVTSVSWSPDAGNYWLCVNSDGAPQINFYSELAGSGVNGSTTDNGGETSMAFTAAFGTWPTNPTPAYINLSELAPEVWIRE